jgi:Ca2+-binding RTX toxin-like protein
MYEYEKQAFRQALAIIETFIPIDFVEVGFLAPQGTPYYENISWGVVHSDTIDGSLGFHQVPGDDGLFEQGFNIPTLFGLFAYNTPLFSQEALAMGGEGFATIVHEILHGLGLAHPHDEGGSSTIFDGVTEPFGDYGTDGQNQAVYTIMSYNSGYASNVPVTDYTYGQAAGPMALDIAALQAIYGTVAHATGNNIYQIKGVNGAGTFWQAIWDTGGNDSISAVGVWRDVYINLNDADLEGSDAGGQISSATGIAGGFTIANTVVIENAFGGYGNDWLVGNEFNNYLGGGVGNDTLSAAAGNDWIFGGAGNDTITGGKGNDTLAGDNGNDWFVNKDDDGNDTINGGQGWDWLQYSGSNGVTLNLSNSGVQNTGYGFDTILNIGHVIGSGQSDVITGDELINYLVGNAGDDVLDGGIKDDVLRGGAGSDTVIGGRGWDTLYGGKGNDIIVGGIGRDDMTGGADNDTFVFNSTDDGSAIRQNADLIRDFTRGEDKIDLSAIDASTVLDGDDAFVFNGQTPATTSDQGEIYYVHSDLEGSLYDRTFVYVDTDGDEEPEMMIKLVGLHDLTADDFIL